MKRFILLLTILLSAISAEAQELLERPRFLDNWSVTVGGGIYHPMLYKIKYLADCSGAGGTFELRKQMSPIVGIGLGVDGYYRMSRKERQDPRSLIGPVLHVNLMNLFGGYTGRPRLFEVEIEGMAAWGHLYRGTTSYYFPDENWFAAKGGFTFMFNLGRARAWGVSLRPALAADLISQPPTPGSVTHSPFPLSRARADLQFYAGVTYRFRNTGGSHHFRFAKRGADEDEIGRLNEIVNFLRRDVEQRDRTIEQMQQEIEVLTPSASPLPEGQDTPAAEPAPTPQDTPQDDPQIAR